MKLYKSKFRDLRSQSLKNVVITGFNGCVSGNNKNLIIDKIRYEIQSI